MKERTFRRTLFALCGLVCCLVGQPGCRIRPEARTDCRATVAPELYGRVWVRDIRLSKEGSQQYTMQVNLVSKANGISRLEYRVDWLDAAGEAIPSVVSTWQPYSLAPFEVGAVQATAPAAEAVDFRFYVKGAR